jgi:hypothetical protein
MNRRWLCVLGIVVAGCGDAEVPDLPGTAQLDDGEGTPALDGTTGLDELAWPPAGPREIAGLFGRVFCRESEHGPVCVAKCEAKGIPCVSAAYHPKNPRSPNGLLYACNKLPPFASMCSYLYQNGDTCHFAHGRRPPYICFLGGGAQ